jgi:DNA polymerase-1
MEKLILIDGYSLANRAFFALPPLTNAAGQPTNAVYGVAMMLLRLVEEEKPDYLAVAFDAGKPTFRHEAYAEYKAGRRPMADELRSQIPLVRRLFEAFGIPVYELQGYEADDLLGTLSCRASEEGLEALIVTGDRDAFQLVSPAVKVLYTKKGITDVQRMDLVAIQERYGLEPKQLIDVKGLMGDASDNIPGVPGIGEKTALRLIQQFNDLSSLLEHLEEVKRPKERQLLEDYREQALQSRDLATIRCDVNISTSWEDCRWKGTNRPSALVFFQEMDFRNLLRRLGREEDISGQTSRQTYTSPEFIVVEDPQNVVEALSELGNGPVSVQFLARRLSRKATHLIGVALGTQSNHFVFIVLSEGKIPSELARWLADANSKKDCYDAKDLLRISSWLGEGLEGLREDYRLAGHLIAGTGGDLTVEKMACDLLGWEDLPDIRNERGNPISLDMIPRDYPIEKVVLAGIGRVHALVNLQDPISKELEKRDLKRLYRDVELPLVYTLFRMEEAGITIDPDKLKALGEKYRMEMELLEQEIYKLVGEKFNIASPKQLGAILFEKLGLPVGKKTKSGYSTDAEVLENLAVEYPVARMVLDYRALAKLNSTYVEALLKIAGESNNKIHTTFQQTVTATGRLSSTEPNLQNIPVRTSEGMEIRRVFLPSPGYTLLSADYSQIELRVMAHFSHDPKYMSAFLEDEDIHARTATEIFGVYPPEVRRQMRDRAKAVNFGILYGISGFGLAKGTGVSRKEAEAYIQTYFERYEGVKSFLDGAISEAREVGYVSTLLGRRRYLPDLVSGNFLRRSFAERTARNTPIQGTAADIIKLAMLRVESRLKKEDLPARMLLQVHDELVLEVKTEALKEVGEAVKEEMECAVELSVPLRADVKSGPNWGEMEPWREVQSHAGTSRS